MTWLTLEHQGRTVRVAALKVAGRLWVHLEGQTMVIDLHAQSRRGGGVAAASTPGVIKAPMPGKVTRVMVQLADSVTKGQSLVVMEAMKMEYTLAADRAGAIETLNAKVGLQVALGEVLVRIGGEA